GVKRYVAQMFLEESESIARIIELYRVNGEGITQPMRTNVVHLSRLRINQL
ncbi:unnamed protein product, partial [marine sediment metagenome]